jgi:hypothetical protein
LADPGGTSDWAELVVGEDTGETGDVS